MHPQDLNLLQPAPPNDPLSRQLLVLCDGTNNTATGGLEDTNVVAWLERLDPNDAAQRVYYDPGVGNPGELPGATWADKAWRKLQRINGLAFGNGVYENIAQSYRFLIEQYQGGDQIYILGFSRGAFTARALAGMVNMFGFLNAEHANMVETLVSIYFSKRGRHGSKAQLLRDARVSQLRRLFVAPERQEVWVHFVGVWDTVASIGLPPLDRQITGSPSMKNADGSPKRYRHVRHALALDEHRDSFLPRPYSNHNFSTTPECEQSLEQRWFPGAHGDVGGGYPSAEAALSTLALNWLWEEACALGLRCPIRPPSSRAPVSARPRVHSETYDTPWWALLGLSVRNPHEARDENDQPIPIAVEACHQAPTLKFPADTVWAQRRSAWPMWLALAVSVTAWWLMGWLLAGAPIHTEGWAPLAQDVFAANWELHRWQMLLVKKDMPQLPAQAHITLALGMDLVFMAAYSYLLARFVTRAFATIAGLRSVHNQSAPVLNFLGSGLKWLVLADLAEDLLTWAATVSGSSVLNGLAQGWVFPASAVKWFGLAMVVVLVVWGLIAAISGRLQRSETKTSSLG